MELIDRNILLKNIYNITGKYENEPTVDKVFDMIKEIVKEIATTPTVNTWISVEDRLPVVGKKVLTVDKYGDYEVAFRDGKDDGGMCCNCGEYGTYPIAWMPIPEYKESE